MSTIFALIVVIWMLAFGRNYYKLQEKVSRLAKEIDRLNCINEIERERSVN